MYLVAGQRYYIEALHKQGAGTDNVAVGWQLPDGTLERPIAGSRLSPPARPQNASPHAIITYPQDGNIFDAPVDITIQADAFDNDGTIAKVEFFEGTRKLGEDMTEPYTFTWQDVPVGEYTIKAIPTDNGGATGSSAPVTFTVRGQCNALNYIVREYWTGVTGNSVSDIPTDRPPTGTQQLTLLEGPTNSGTNYGARIRGYVCPPASGNYVFWIASNDNSELWLSTDDNPANKRRIAYVNGATSPREWTKYASQKSTTISLLTGKQYYVEILHKQGAGTDNIAVGWQLPDGSLERPIQGGRLSPFGVITYPEVTITSPTDGQKFASGEDIMFKVEASDPDGIAHIAYYNHGSKIRECYGESCDWSANWYPPGEYSLTAVATDRYDYQSTSQVVNFTIEEACQASGTITREVWTNIQGNSVSDIPLDSPPNSTTELTSLEGPVNSGTNYGARIRGYICTPSPALYTFWIASNDHSELWLSTDADPANKRRIAFVQGATAYREWEKYTTQRVTLQLEGHKTYYIEVLHKQGIGSDHVSVGWYISDGILERPIPGTRLSPFDPNASAAHAGARASGGTASELKYSQLDIYPNPAAGGDELMVSGYGQFDQAVETEVEIVNLTGEIVFSEKFRCGGDCAGYVLNLEKQLVRGLYLVNLKTNGAKFSKRLLVK
jgi:hypothetical protein